MFILYHMQGQLAVVDSSLPDDAGDDAAKAAAKAIAENHPGREVFIAKPIGAMLAPQTEAAWNDMGPRAGQVPA